MKATRPVSRKYPYSAFILTPAYKVRPVTFVRKSTWSRHDGDLTTENKYYAVEQIHTTKADAIAFGRKQIEAREAYLEKQHALLDARRIKMDKAESEG